MKTVESAIISSQFPQNCPIRVEIWSNDMVGFKEYKDFHEYIMNAGYVEKKSECRLIEDKVDIFGSHLIVCYTKKE